MGFIDEDEQVALGAKPAGILAFSSAMKSSLASSSSRSSSLPRNLWTREQMSHG